MRFLILLCPLIARANVIAEDALGDGSSPSTEGLALLVSAFFVYCACIALKDRDWNGVALMVGIAGAAWINTTVTALVIMVLVVLIPVGIIVDKVRKG